VKERGHPLEEELPGFGIEIGLVLAAERRLWSGGRSRSRARPRGLGALDERLGVMPGPPALPTVTIAAGNAAAS
jgi:hypothetical protein